MGGQFVNIIFSLVQVLFTTGEQLGRDCHQHQAISLSHEQTSRMYLCINESLKTGNPFLHGVQIGNHKKAHNPEGPMYQ